MAVTTAAVIGAGAAVAGVAQSAKNSKDAINAQKDQNQTNEAFIKSQGARSRQHIIPLFEASQKNLAAGAQSSMDIFKQTIPGQAEAFTEGNYRAQQQLLAGLPQIKNALMGLPVDLSGLQAQRLPVDTSFANATMPNFRYPNLNKPKETPLTPAQQALLGQGGLQ